MEEPLLGAVGLARAGQGVAWVRRRLLDVGGDKALPFLPWQEESNPYLGWRGARFLLGNPAVFETQVRALARLSREAAAEVSCALVRLELGYRSKLHSVGAGVTEYKINFGPGVPDLFRSRR